MSISKNIILFICAYALCSIVPDMILAIPLAYMLSKV